ncbi:lectin C-type domain protein, partial [Ostertagia ostertagi]
MNLLQDVTAMAFSTCVFALVSMNPNTLPRLGKYCESKLCHVKMTDLRDCEIQCDDRTHYPPIPSEYDRIPGLPDRGSPEVDSIESDLRPPPREYPSRDDTRPPYGGRPFNGYPRPGRRPPGESPFNVDRYFGNPNFRYDRPSRGYKICYVTGYSYKYVKTPSTWNEARAACRAHGAELASIHSKKENEFIYNLVKNERKQIRNPYNTVWIGARRGPSGRFEWSDGSRFSFQYWAKDEPNNYRGRENCVS